MKNYHAVGIAICAAVMLTCALSLTDTVHAADHQPAIKHHYITQAPAEVDVPPERCPKATEYNTGWAVEDTNHDGNADHAWRVYNSGPCKLQAVDQTNSAGLIVEFKP